MLVFLLRINNVNFQVNINLTKSVSTSLAECISFAEDKQGVYCVLFVVFFAYYYRLGERNRRRRSQI